MRFHRFALLTTLAIGGSSLLACTGDDNSLPLPPEAGADAKASDASSGDATTEKADAGDGGKESDAEADATTDATTSEPDAGDGSTPDAQADAAVDAAPGTPADASQDAPTGEPADAADNGG